MKKIISCLIIMTMLITSSISVFAAENTTDPVAVESQNCIIDDNEIMAEVKASEMLPDDWDIDINAKKISSSLARTLTDEDDLGDNNYIVEVNATSKPEIESKKYNSNGIDVTMHLTMVWLDVKGTKNVLQTLSGSNTLTKGTITSGTIYWGDTASELRGSASVGKNSFSKSINYTSQDGFGRLYGMYKLLIKGDGGKTYPVELKVTSSALS